MMEKLYLCDNTIFNHKGTKTLSTTLSIDVENYFKKISKKHLTISNQCGLSFFSGQPKKLAIIFSGYINTVFIIFSRIIP
jgi:hypothetical protein